MNTEGSNKHTASILKDETFQWSRNKRKPRKYWL